MTYPARAVRPGPRALVPEQVGEVTTTLAPVRAGPGARSRPVPPEEMPGGPEPWSETVLAFVALHRPRLLRLGLHLVVAALPLLAISAHVFGIAPMHLTAGLVVVPLALVVLLLGLFAPAPEDRLMLAGVVWGVLATLVYDAVRLDTVYLLGLWGDFIPTVGTWIVDVDAGSSVVGAIVGYVWRYVGDGGGIGVAFFVLVAATGLRRWGRRATVTAAVVFAVFPVWTGLVATVAIAPRGEQQMFPLTVTTVSLSLLGHLVFGLVLGLGCSRCRRLEEHWPWPPLLDLRRGTRVADVVVAPAARPATDDDWGPAALVTAGGDDPEITEIRVEPPVRARPTSRRGPLGPASGSVPVVDVRSGPLPVSGAPFGLLPVTGPRSGPIPAWDPRPGPVPAGPATRATGTATRTAEPRASGRGRGRSRGRGRGRSPDRCPSRWPGRGRAASRPAPPTRGSVRDAAGPRVAPKRTRAGRRGTSVRPAGGDLSGRRVMDGRSRGRSPWSGGRAATRTSASATPQSPWAALDRRRDPGPRRLPFVVLAVVAAAVLLVGVAGGGGTPLISHGGLVSVADGDDADGSEDSGSDGSGDSGDSGGGQDDEQDQQDDGEDEFPGRDEIGRAGADEYVDITDVERVRSRGEGGDFSGGSYSVRCALSDHKNSDNPIIAPGVRNGAQHTHDYAGNESTNFASDEETLEESSTTCTNGDRSPIFWPVLRDLRGVGPDVGVDGGSLDGNVGSFIEPDTVDITFHGHGSRRTQAMPLNMVLVTGSAKAGTNDGEGANAKYSCSGSGRLTDLYPICPEGSSLLRVFDFPSCWNGEDLDSEDHTTHIVYPDEDGECADDLIPVPALRITVGYGNPPPGRLFAIDSFPEQQHDPVTDHTLLEYLSSERRAQEGAACINAARRCVQGADDDAAAAGSTDDADRVPRSQSFAHVLATHGKHGGEHGAGRTHDSGHAAPHGRESAAPAPCAGPPPARFTAPGWAPPAPRREHAAGVAGEPALPCCC